ncbi:hypothetical protein MF271_19490 (plasmid) [Deinococcus sp. KNUC1210]|uniref:hypothetical protein n=1 Tax=Deinococcus sp. KNUC1210 TaxID=2917691 RepID=UPI001EF133F3|nr:hypothetical protein [Deinococcus sp. KNUC1210]ULH17376.1 hypothetical protein MF271_19490 [Deinococcus sp. KNUC1210]
MGLKTKRVAFTFDETSLRTLEQMTEEGKYTSMADCVRESLQITRALSTLAGHGFSELHVRNQHTSEDIEIVVPRFRLLRRV